MATIHPEKTPMGKAILECLRRGPATTRELAPQIGYKTGRVSQMIHYLVDTGAVRPTGECRGVGFNAVKVWEVDPGE
jgi:hypothetical protein